MAKKQDDKLNYPVILRELKEKGPQRLYLLWGQEDYLREQYNLGAMDIIEAAKRAIARK